MIFVASTASPEKDANLRAFVGRLNDVGINVIYETVSPTKNDCSFSNYAALKDLRDYVNLEVVTDDGPGQIRMLELVMPLLERGINSKSPASSHQTPAPQPNPSMVNKLKELIEGRPPEREQQAARPSNTPVPKDASTAKNTATAKNIAAPKNTATAKPQMDQDSAAPRPPGTLPDRPAVAPPEQPPADSAVAHPLPAGRTSAQARVVVKVDFTNTDQEAQKAKRDLMAKGLKEEEVFIKPGTRNGKPEFGIFIGPFTGTKEARRRCDELKLPEKQCYLQNSR